MLVPVRSFFKAQMGRNEFESGMDAEFQAHKQAYADDLIAQGVPSEEALRRASIEFGSAGALKEDCRKAKGLVWPDELARNLSYALRVLRRSPVFTATVVATLSLCIGANTSVFSLVSAVMFRALPFPDPDRLAVIAMTQRGNGAGFQNSGATGTWCELVRVHTLIAGVIGDVQQGAAGWGGFGAYAYRNPSLAIGVPTLNGRVTS